MSVGELRLLRLNMYRPPPVESTMNAVCPSSDKAIPVN